IFYGMSILSQENWLKDHAVVVEDKKIKAIIPAEMIKHHLPAKEYHFSASDYLVPGFIDLHIHGIQGWDVMDANHAAFAGISKALAAQGVTGFLATTMTADNERIENVLKLIPEMKTSLEEAALLGVHLEGPFLAAEKMGAQDVRLAQMPNKVLIEHWQKISGDNIRIVTLAPELPDALTLIKHLVEAGIIASVGHTHATYAETTAAITAGCSHATHLFNAMRGLHQREPGAVGALLLANAVLAELIVDGLHLHPAIVELAWRIKGKQHLLLVTDAMRATCMGNGQYELGGQRVMVENAKATLSDGTLAGSTLTMPQAIKNMLQFTKASLAEVIAMATATPAATLKLQQRKGSIEVEKDADLVIMHADYSIALTMREGREVFRA
ncbi:MAG: N-acetylglucosamine-6-phosphate deacetylase, partial [Gammaproteobacteria bacterium]|nr:N-acetylglucosamine-6-phosphate deacetylase [Gammaproteobacteria bacterium]